MTVRGMTLDSSMGSCWSDQRTASEDLLRAAENTIYAEASE
jgi:hypothetical protein